MWKNAKKEMMLHYIEFLYKDERKKSNYYKAVNNDSFNIMNRTLSSSHSSLIKELKKHQNRSPKEKSLNRITVIVDDTCNGKRYSKKNKSSHKNLDNSLKKVVMTHNVVYLVYTVGTGKTCEKHLLDYRVWKKGKKKKSELFLEMLLDLKKTLQAEGLNLKDFVVVFDSGYSHESVLKELDKDFLFVGKFHHRKKYTINGKKQVLSTFLKKRFRKETFTEVNKKYSKSIQEKYYKYISISELPYKFMLTLFKSKGHKKRNRRLLVTNLNRHAYFSIIGRYRQRYYIENVFRDLKQLYHYNHFHTNDQKNKLDTHICICIMRYELIQVLKRECFSMKMTNGQVVKQLRKWLMEMSLDEREKWFSFFVTGEPISYKRE